MNMCTTIQCTVNWYALAGKKKSKMKRIDDAHILEWSQVELTQKPAGRRDVGRPRIRLSDFF